MKTQATSVGDSANQPSKRAPVTALKKMESRDPILQEGENGHYRLEAISDLWNEFDDLWTELDITRLLEEHIPLHRRYLVDRLHRIRIDIESQVGDQCISS